ncbi:pyridoxamine 5'-phosphate oxidase family protein [Hoeflea sp. Naph1]|uniref:2Fe-2S iron-sulfur cluster-binding protein n=1 Tax=Hoeflea sp. Naph1 TaxID=3388653 RepID=UPI0039900083
MQKIAGVEAQMAEIGQRVVRDHLIDQHREFYLQLPSVTIGSVDPGGDVWATVRVARPGFLHTPDVHMLRVDLDRDPADPADAGLNDGDAVAILGIELHTRRRNRLNGTIRRYSPLGFDIAVGQSYGNCAQYIQLRDDHRFVREPTLKTNQPTRQMRRLDAAAKMLIAQADTFFVASYVERMIGQREVDVSHRGGKRSFVRIGEDGVLTIPDFAGNRFFNTLGNILTNGKAGLVFIDFDNGSLLQLTGDAEVILDAPEINAFQGAERFWRFTPRRIIHRPDALALRWHFRENGWSPNTLMTGSWSEVANRLKPAIHATNWRPFRITRIVQESAVVRSFYLEPADGNGLIQQHAGQHLPIRLQGAESRAIRTYTLSTAPSDGVYRISVKREGRISSILHNSICEGDIIEARAPSGSFTIDTAETRPAVLLAAGIGITPLLAMLRDLLHEGLRKRHFRPAWLVYSCHTKADRAFDSEIEKLVAGAQGAFRLVRILGDTTDAMLGADYEIAGRIDMRLLSEMLPFNDCDFYLCGPIGFMQSMYDGLTSLSIGDDRIHAEAFGPAALIRERHRTAKEVDFAAAARTSIPVRFRRSDIETTWEPGAGTLLELAEASHLSPEFGCRAGNCGTCRTKIISGAVTYLIEPTALLEEDEALICRAVPAEVEHGKPSKLELDL